MKHPDYPRISSKVVRGKIFWRFMNGSRPLLPGQPHTSEFDAAYKALTEGRIVRKADVVRLSTAAHPASLKAAWQKVQETAKWKKLDPKSQRLYTRYIEEFLEQPAGNGMKKGDGPIADFKARHVQEALDASTPVKAKMLMVVFKKMAKVAIRQDWIEYDPTAGAERPEIISESKDAWPPHVCAQFELRWPIGSRPRTAYEMAKWLGTRRSDVGSIRWDHLVTQIVDGKAVEGFKFVQYKGRNRKGAFAKFHPISPMLAEALSTLPRDTETVLAKPDGQPYQIEGLTTMMWHWTRKAGIEKGYSFHGLRHTMGAMLADADASDVQTQDVLGHATISEQNKYKKGRNQARSAAAGMQAVVRLVRGGG